MTSADAYLSGKPCPKCGYVRTPADTNPSWQCPRCHVAYLKVEPGALLRTQLVAGSRELVAEGASDRSVYALIAANLFAAAVAVAFGMTLLDLMLVYWVQSVIIGISFFIRIVSLRKFTTEGVEESASKGLPWYRHWNHAEDEQRQFWAHWDPEDPSTKWKVALLFLFHYGFFHVVYLEFITDGPDPAGSVPGSASSAGLYLCALAFAVNHAFSLRHNILKDRLGTPNLRTLMTLPYYRIIPMHATIILGGVFFGGAAALILFIVLKTIADVAMHTIEHHVLRPD